MKRRDLLDRVFWASNVAVLAGLFFGLDPYRREPLRYGYGPDRRAFFAATLEKAQELDRSGSFRIPAEASWHLLHGWEEVGGARARLRSRRGILALPITVVRPLEVQIDLHPLPEGGGEPGAVEIEYGINGRPAGRETIPAKGGSLRFGVAPSQLFRGDNTIYLYRVTRRADPSPWLSVGELRVQAEVAESPPAPLR